MTTEELREIVSAVMQELESSGVDFDYTIQTAEDTDLVFVIRGNAPDYQGKVITWKGLLDIITAQATQAKNDAVTAKNTANTILTQVQSKGSEITNFVATSKAEIETQKNEAVESVRNVYQSDLNAESTARQTADNTLQQNIDSEASTRSEADTAIGARIDSETTTRESEVAELERVNAIQKYEIENLKAKAEGKIYREETVEAEAYDLDIPSSVAPYAEVKRIKGKSVVWSQLEGSSKQNIYSDHYYIYIVDAEVLEDKTNIYFYMRQVGYTQNNQAIMGPYNIGNHRLYWKTRPTKGTSTEGDYDILILEGKAIISNKMLIDLTQIFGLGNEPTEEECMRIFSAEYYPFDAGTIRSFPVKTVRSVNAEGTEIGSMDVSSVTSDLKSAGSVYDEWSNGKKVTRIKVIENLGSMNWSFTSTHSYIILNNPKRSGRCLANMPSKITKFNINDVNDGFVIDYAEGSYASKDELLADLQGVTLHYEMNTPIEEEVPEIDNYIEVEGGGTLTFESDETVQMPIPSTTRFVVDLT